MAVSTLTRRTYILTFSQKSSDESDDVRVARSIIPDTPRPPYPYLARRLHKEGAVDLLLRVRSDGTAQEAKVIRGTGFPLLDLITQQWAIRYWKLPGFSAQISMPSRFFIEGNSVLTTG